MYNRAMENKSIQISFYQPKYQATFESLNKAWIEKYFWIEPIDVEVLQNPEKNILAAGGEILIALVDDQPVGVVALKRVNETVLEFTKMAVDEKFQGKKIGEKLEEKLKEF